MRGQAWREFIYTHVSGGIARRIDFERGTASRVVIDSRDTLRVIPDSTLIVMVDRVDSVGGAPVVTSINVARLPAATIYTPPPAVMPTREEYARMMLEFAETGKADNKFTQFLNTVPVVREFIR